MSYRIAAIDVHKKMLAVVVADIAVQGEYDFERRQFSSSPDQLRVLAEWLVEQKIREVVEDPGSGHGIYSPVLEAGVANPGAVLENRVPKVGRCRSDVWNAASGTSAV
jgi:hypothetical protein